MSNYVRVLTKQEHAAEEDSQMGCFSGLICCALAVVYYNQWIGELHSPAKKVGVITAGLISLYLGCALGHLVWGIIGLAFAGYVGWETLQWIMA